MASQKIIWIAVPRGFRIVAGVRRARVSVYVSPQLAPAGTTLAGSDWVDWPSRLRKPDVSFQLRFGNTTVAAKFDDVLEPVLWRALFNSNTFVRPFQTDDNSGVFQSYRAGKLHDVLKDGYQEVLHRSPVKRPTSLPTGFERLVRLFLPAVADSEIDYLAMPSDDSSRARVSRELFRPDRPDRNRAAVLDRLVDLAMQEAALRRDGARGTPVEIVPDTGDPASYLEQFYAFHRQPAGTASIHPATADAERVDFHQKIANLGEYPLVQKWMGLVLDFDVDATNIPLTGTGAHGLLTVVPKFGPPPLTPGAAHVTPSTAYTLTADRFDAAPDPSLPREAVRGLANLALTEPGSNNPIFRLLQLDVDSAGMKAVDLLARTASGDSDATLASLRDGGVSIVRHGNGAFLMEAIDIGLEKVQAAINGQAVTLFAENLIRGYRVDVRDAGGWRSLHERAGSYLFSPTETRSKEDEGFVQPSLVQPFIPGSSTSSRHNRSAPNYLSEALFHWQGWSLAAHRPGPEIPQPDEPSASAATDPRLKASFRAKRRSLPRLRFDSEYQFRIRLVDVAGAGPTSGEADTVLAALDSAGERSPILPAGTAKMRYLRFDAIPSPVVLPRVPLGHGAAVDRIVLRSNHNVTAKDYTNQHPEHPEYELDGERHLLPPRVPQIIAEMSGLFDAAIGTDADLDRTHALVKRSLQTLDEEGAHPEPAVTVPYLPDPLAAGVAFRDLPSVVSGVVGSVDTGRFQIKSRLPPGPESVTGSVVPLSFGPQPWPDAKPIRLALKEGVGTPVWNAGDRVLTVFLPKGESRRISLSSYLPGDGPLRFLGMWSWLIERLDQLVASGQLTPNDRNARESQLKSLAMLGILWMLTPARTITLVHAVQQPLEPPTITRLALSRPPGATFAGVDAAIRVHAQTSGQLELRATWSEPAPDGGTPTSMSGSVFATPTVIPVGRDTMAFSSVTMDELDLQVSDAVNRMRAQFEEFLGNTRRFRPPSADAVREVIQFKSTWQPMLFAYDGLPLTERWRELSGVGVNINSVALAMRERPPEAPGSFPFGLHPEVQKVEQVALELRDHAQRAIDTVATMRAGPHHDFGDTKHRTITYRAVTTTRFGDCFADRGLARTRASAGVVVPLKSTASPLRPQVRNLVPAFPWKRAGDVAQGYTSERGAGAVRVYLDGPWFSSGAGELLGVVVASPLDPNPFTAANIGADQADWGRDPIWRTEEFRVLPLETDFDNAVTGPHEFRRPDRDRRLVTVIGFNVAFDADGHCFSDIVLDPKRSYFPFVRLALTRYQPMSITGCEISPIVLTDFAQLSPRRAVSVIRRDQRLYAVTVSGDTHQTPNSVGGSGTRVRISVQQRIPGTNDDAGWLPAVGATPTPGQTEPGQLWTGTVGVPDLDSTPLRLLIEELEDHGPAERVVFAETVPI